jgi:hypothetical protein
MTACCALLHLMGERGMFDVCDITRQVLSAHVSDVRARPGEVRGTGGQQASATASATGVRRQLQSVMQAFSSRASATAATAGESAMSDRSVYGGASQHGTGSAQAETERFVLAAAVQTHLQRQLHQWLHALLPRPTATVTATNNATK